jgi:alpha-1,2-mannosyltransferase
VPLRRRDRLSADEKPRVVLGFFHPYCDAGGGGERVLWTAVAESVRSAASNVAVRCVVYTGDVSADPRRIADNALRRFGIDVRALLDDGSLEMMYLHRRPAVEAVAWPHFTLLGQSLGSMYLGKSF